MEALLRHHVQESLDLCLFKNAVFLAERLYHEHPSNEHLHLVAQCYMRAGDPGTAYRLLSHHKPFHPGPADVGGSGPMEPDRGSQWKCLYLLGVVCGMTERFQECETLMERLRASGGEHAGISYWLGLAGKHLGRRSAAKNFQACVQQNPFIFVAFEEAAKCEGDVEAVNPYKALLLQQQSAQGRPSHQAGAPGAFANHSDPVPSDRNSSSRRLSQQPRQSTAASAPNLSAGRHQPSPVPIPIRPAANDTLRGPHEGPIAVLTVLKHMAQAATLLHAYRCGDALAMLTSSAMPQPKSGWVLISAALAAFHAGDTAECVKHFGQLRGLEPWRLNDEALVYYSTALWHLADEAKLAQLTQTMIEAIPTSSVALAVSGNCYSLVRDPKSALVMLQRACQANPWHAYAHCVRGYELLYADKQEEAESAFFEATKLEPRLYTAYAGFGSIAFQEGHDDKARQYFLMALRVNPLVSIYNCLARTYCRENATIESLKTALEYYDEGLSRSPKHFAARHQRATVLIRLGRIDTALLELERLCEEAPGEAMTHIELGRCLAKLGRKAQAVTALHRAMDLDPRRRPLVKDMLERLSATQRTTVDE